VAAFDAQFADPDFVTYVRTTDGVEIDSLGERAAEHGSWTGTWRGGTALSGTYLAVWKKVTGQWVLETELYVTINQ
jgi:hypothetical protein